MKSKTIGSSEQDERGLPKILIGSSGKGKSKFLEEMIREDLRAGHGFCLSLRTRSITSLDSSSIPTSRKKKS
jgi:hypothetical protein